MNLHEETLYRFGPFCYDAEQRLLFHGEEAVPLAPKLEQTLRVLIERHGMVVEKAELMRAVWPDTAVEEIGLTRNISQLRKALGDEGEVFRYIETLPKRGYRFIGIVVRGDPKKNHSASGVSSSLRAAHLGKILIVAGAMALLCLLVYWQFYRPSRFLSAGERIANIAVVPFECLSPELDCGVFPHGLTDLLVANLSKIDSVHVLSPATVSRYQRARLSTAFMARILGLDLTLEGTIQRAGDRVRVTARLVDVHSAKLVWSDSYEYPVESLGEAQAQAASQIAAQVGARVAVRGRNVH